MLSKKNTICVCGAGTMGIGITQLAVQSGFSTIVFDSEEQVLQKAKGVLENTFSAMVSKDKISTEQKDAYLHSIQFVTDLSACRADLVIEAIVENASAKAELFSQLARINTSETIIATNTSSLSVSGLAENVPHPSRVLGMHFFNPAPIMKLVEVVKAVQTSDEAVTTICELAIRMGKTPVVCKDSPGFIVNRVARHYYLEALRLVEEGFADFESVDEILEATGFKMGPFRLMDLIGNDVNFAVTKSIYEAFNKPERFRPSPIQQEKLSKKELGRKTGKGYYSYP